MVTLVVRVVIGFVYIGDKIRYILSIHIGVFAQRPVIASPSVKLVKRYGSAGGRGG